MSEEKSASFSRLDDELTWGKLGGFWATILGTILIIVFCWREGTMIFSLLAMAGAIVGWLLGMLIAPLDEREAQDFSVFIKVISGFVTGYLLSKVDSLITSLVAINPSTGAALISDEVVAKRTLICLCSFGVSLLTVFSFRAYWSAKREGKRMIDPAANPSDEQLSFDRSEHEQA